MSRLWHRAFLWSPALALTLQLVLVAAAAAASGGADFPLRR
ncbi:MAG: hypothetical protein ABIW50_00965 [Candidatus Limnocylindria bacterium]